MLTDKNSIIATIIESEENLLSALECYNTFEDVVSKLIRSRADKLNLAIQQRPELSRFTAAYQRTMYYNNKWNQPLFLSHTYDGPGSIFFLTFESENSSLSGVYLGIRKRNEDIKVKFPEFENDLNMVLTSEFNQSSIVTDYWVWSCLEKTPWNNWLCPEALCGLLGEELTDAENDLLDLAVVFGKFCENWPIKE